MKRNETKTRTVWYCRMDDKDIKAFDNEIDACIFMSRYIAEKFGKYYCVSRFENGGWAFNSRVVKTKVVGSSSYPEMVNARYEDSLKATEPVVEESKSSGQIRWKYQVQVQTANKVGWIDYKGSMEDENGDVCNYLFDTEKEAQKVCSDIAFHSSNVLSEWNDVARIKKVGELI